MCLPVNPSSAPSSSNSFSFLSVSLYSFIFLLYINRWSASHSTTWASSTSGWVGGIGVSPMLLSCVSVGSPASASSTGPSGSFVGCISTSVVVWADSVDYSEIAGLGLLSLFYPFLPFLTLGILKFNFNINVFKIWWELSWPVEKVWLTDQPSTFAWLFIWCRGFMLSRDMCTGTELPPSWDRGVRVTCEYHLHSNPSRVSYHPPHSAYNLSCFVYICVVPVLWTSSFV